MKTSDKQIAANQQNAQKSTGPTSDEGKATASKNSLKHGLLAKEVVITAGDGVEDQAEFDALLSALVDQYAPQGPLEDILVEKIAVAHWRLRRAYRFEVGLIRSDLDDTTKKYYSPSYSDPPKTDDQIDDEIIVCEELRDKWQAVKVRLSRLHEDGEPLEAIYDLHESWNLLSDFYNSITGKQLDGSPADIHQFFKQANCEDETLWKCLLRACNDQIQLYAQKLLDLHNEKEKHHRNLQVRKKLNSFSTSNNMDKFLKYESALERQFYKAINQLERLQRMRAGEAVPPPVNLDVHLDIDRDT